MKSRMQITIIADPYVNDGVDTFNKDEIHTVDWNRGKHLVDNEFAISNEYISDFSFDKNNKITLDIHDQQIYSKSKI